MLLHTPYNNALLAAPAALLLEYNNWLLPAYYYYTFPPKPNKLTHRMSHAMRLFD